MRMFNTRKTINPITKLEKDLDRYFSKEDVQRVHKYMKGYSTNQQTTSADEEVEKREP